MMIKQPTPILRKPKIIFLFDDFTGTAGCAMVACNGFSGIGGTAVVDVVASAALVVAVVVVGVGVSTGVDVTVEDGVGDGMGGATGVGVGASDGAAAGVDAGGSTAAPQA